ncbi:MAG: phosphoribosyltransferase family protein [Bacilli bacterium]|nr:phosphoribosyltransferase family protein [Bacilli bacterium]
MCDKCFSELKVTFQKEKIVRIELLSIFEYNEAMKTILFTYKGLGDIELRNVFLERYSLYLKFKYRNYLLVPAPSTLESESIKGFNHVEAMFSCINKNIVKLLHKKESFKQSDLSFKERQNVHKKIEIIDGERLRNKKVLIIDDLKTTGATIKAIIELITPFSPKKIKVLTVVATKVNT